MSCHGDMSRHVIRQVTLRRTVTLRSSWVPMDPGRSSKVIDEKDWARFIRCLAESEDEIK
eukprot:scaffold176605_cov60-Cyclotella_meneghiniana.AAC.2